MALFLTAYGGHGGFLEGFWPWRRANYMDRVLKQYVEAVMENSEMLAYWPVFFNHYFLLTIHNVFERLSFELLSLRLSGLFLELFFHIDCWMTRYSELSANCNSLSFGNTWRVIKLEMKTLLFLFYNFYLSVKHATSVEHNKTTSNMSVLVYTDSCSTSIALNQRKADELLNRILYRHFYCKKIINMYKKLQDAIYSIDESMLF